MKQPIFIVAALLLMALPARAQAPATTTAAAPAPTGAAGAPADAATAAADPNTSPPPEAPQPLKESFSRSLFFTQGDLVDIKNAINGITSNGLLGEATEKPIPQVRTIVITGMNYFSPDNWIVWLNGQKITPYIRPSEVQEIEVHPGVVHLKWFDIGANKTLRLSMRPNEVYDIVTGVTLPDQTQVGP